MDYICQELQKIIEFFENKSSSESNRYDLSSYFDACCVIETKKKNISHLIVDLQNIGVIAGGSVVYSLNDFVPKNSVGDIDIFVDTIDNFRKCLRLIHDFYPDKEFQHFFIVNEKGEKEISIVSIEIEENKPSIQLILKDFESPLEIIEFFDLDYVQCAIHQNIVYNTKRCRESHSSRKILKFSDIRFREGRLEKAAKKGFYTPVINNEKCVSDQELISISYEELISYDLKFFQQSRYLDDCDRKAWYVMDTVKIKRIDVDKRESPSKTHNIFPFKNTYFSTIVSFEDEEGEDYEVRVNTFSYNFNIFEIYEDNQNILIANDDFFNSSKLKYNSRTQGREISNFRKGYNSLIVKPYYFTDYEEKLRGKLLLSKTS